MDPHELNARLLRFRSQPQREDPRALARDLMTAQRYGDARGVVVSALGDDGSDPGLLVLEGRAWMMEGDLVQAQSALVRAAKADSDNAEAYRWLGEVLLARGDSTRAGRALERGLALNPDDADVRRLLERVADDAEAGARADAPSPSIGRDDDRRAHAASPPSTLQRPRVTPAPEPSTSELPSLRSSVSPAQSFAPRGSTLPPPPVTPVPEAPSSASAGASSSVLPPRPSSPYVETLPPPPVTPVPDAPSVQAAVARASSLPPPPRVPQGASPMPGSTAAGAYEPPMGADERTRRASYDGLADAPPPPAERMSSVPPPPAERMSSVPPPPAERISSVLPPPPAERMSSVPPPPAERMSSVPPPPAGRMSSVPPPAARGDSTIDIGSLGSLASSSAASALSGGQRVLARASGSLRRLSEVTTTTARHAAAGGWSAKRSGIALGVVLVVLVGAWLGWQRWQAHQGVMVDKLVQRAQIALRSGDATALRNAEAFLQDASNRAPESAAVAQAEIFLEAETLLAGVGEDTAALKAALDRGTRLGVDARWLAVAQALVDHHGRDPAAANATLDPILETVQGHAELSYLVGRAALQHGHPQARALLESALQAEPSLHAARVALAGPLLVAGQRAQALALLEPALSGGDEHVRARLWQLFAKGKAVPPAESRARLDALKSLAQSGAPIDRALWSLGHARVLRAQGDRAGAVAALGETLETATHEPALAALVAREALGVGDPSLAERAAAQAITAAPTVPHRVLLARAHLSRQDGARALAALDGIAADDPALVLLRARAALQGDAEQAWMTTLKELSELPELGGEAAVEKAALELALQARVAPRWALLGQARRLVRRSEGDPDALRALGEVGLALRKTDIAIEAFGKLVEAAPQDGEAQMLLGCARYRAGDAEGAQAAFVAAIELVPGYVGALRGLSALLLDMGRYDEAAAVHADLLKRPDGALAGKLGRIAELLGTGKPDDARKQYDALNETERDSNAGRVMGARVALARERPKEAIALVEPLAKADGAEAALLALYADALYAADNVNAAAVWYARAMKADSKLPEALIGRAEVHLRAERPYDAMPLLERAEEALHTTLRPPSLHARMQTLMGRGYCERARRGDLDLAVEVLNRAIAQPIVPPEAYFWLGEALGGRDTPPASIAFRRYLELAPEGRYAERARRALGPLL